MPDEKHPLDEHIDALNKAAAGLASFKERFPASALKGLGVSDPGPSMDSAYSNPNTEYGLGRALRARAGILGK